MKRLKDTIDPGKWEDFLQRNAFATPFQGPDFRSFFDRVPGQKAIVYGIGNDSELRAVCVVTIQQEKGLKSYFSRRAIVYGGPVFSDDAALSALLEWMNEDLKKSVIYIETRNFKDYSSAAPIFREHGWNYVPYLNFQLAFDEKNADALVAAMKYNRRREIRLSLDEGAVHEEAADETDIEALYEILKDLYDTRVKLPLPDLEYFRALYRSACGKVFVVRHAGKVIGGSFCVYAPGMWIYTLYYCGIRDYNKKIFPTHLAIVAAIRYGTESGLRGIDLMGAGKPEEEYGVRKYKSEFGGTLVEHGRFIRICRPALYKIGLRGLALLKKIRK